ncbi:MAG: hypothetical protein AB7Q29_17030 [Vicinamibacterales bacterium]
MSPGAARSSGDDFAAGSGTDTRRGVASAVTGMTPGMDNKARSATAGASQTLPIEHVGIGEDSPEASSATALR